MIQVICVMLTDAVSAGQASRTTLLAEGAVAGAGDMADTGASFKNEIEAAIAIRCCLARPSQLLTFACDENLCTRSNKDVNDNDDNRRSRLREHHNETVQRVAVQYLARIRTLFFAW